MITLSYPFEKIDLKKVRSVCALETLLEMALNIERYDWCAKLRDEINFRTANQKQIV